MGGVPESDAYAATCLERDVRQALQVLNLRDFERFMRLLAVRSGQLVSANALAGEVGVSATTIKAWCSIATMLAKKWILSWLWAKRYTPWNASGASDRADKSQAL